MSITTQWARASLLVILLALVAGVTPNLFANTTAGDCFVMGGGTGFTTIQLAVNNVTAGATVYVCPGTYAEQVVINKSLKLTGVQVTAGTLDSPVVVPPSGGLVQNGTDIFGNPVAAQILVTGASAVTIEKITVDGTGNNIGNGGANGSACSSPTLEGIYLQNSSGTITDNVVRNQYQTDYSAYGGCQNGLAINVESLTTSSVVTVSNNSVRAYQKNGITATGAATGSGAPGPAVTIQNNYIVGFAATAMNWPLSGAAENGVQVGFGASGKVTGNMVVDNIWGQDTSTDTGDAASGILVYASNGITITSNEVGSSQFGIAVVTDNTFGYGTADGATVTTNKVAGTQLFDAIDACSNSNTVESNTIYGSTESGIHLDSTCSVGSNKTGGSNTVTKNTINEGCAGVLLGSGTGNSVTSNTFYNVTNTTQAGDVCSGGPVANGAGLVPGRRSLRPSPYRPSHK
jgi:hypothetical protein